MQLRQQLKASAMIECCYTFAKLSTCRRRKTGCVIVSTDFQRVLSIGYNGQPAGAPNDGCTGQMGQCGCLHAEANAIAKVQAWEDCYLFCVVCPCPTCLELINAHVHIITAYFTEDYRIEPKRTQKLCYFIPVLES